MARRRAAARADEGTIAIVMALSTMMIFGFAALVVDLGHARDVRRQAQNAADASALAAGNELYLNTTIPRFAQAVSAAQNYALENYQVPLTAWATCTDSEALAHVPAGSTACISFDDATKPTEVRVKVPTRTVDTPFATVMGVSDVDVAARAHASLVPDTVSPCALCVLGSGTTHDLNNGDVEVGGGDIHFNGSVDAKANGLVATDGTITAEGTASPATSFSPPATQNVPPITDPLSSVPLPPAGMSSLTAKSNPCNEGPGVYGALTVSNITCTLQPGLYVIAGSSATKWAFAGSDTTKLKGTGVTLYFTCGTSSVPAPCSNSQGAWLDASGNGTIELSAPTSGPLKGFGIVYDRGNTSNLVLRGNGAQSMTGTIYATSGGLVIAGNACNTSYNSLLVVNKLTLEGNPSCLKSVYAAAYNIDLPPAGLHLNQ